ncbi:MAG: ABC transporter ATP-binding protein [Spirochaetaceae bacterium]|jgi:ABC-type dipeptide/oligopeptide/nickel transport system ATPase component|nr:ABC transporter ATP-binding protein [Spirochaetaceae bacterium]
MILAISGLTICFPVPGGIIAPVRDFNLALNRGEILGLTGPSGCGKTVFATSLLGMVESPGYIQSGSIRYFSGKTEDAGKENPPDLTALSENQWRHIRGKEISMIFQNPFQSFNHSRTIGAQFIEAIKAHRPHVSRQECKEITLSMLDSAMLKKPCEIMKRYPFELSGGMCQRVMIALSLVHHPALLIADEPTTALDKKNEEQILLFFTRIRENYHTGIILISHDEKVIGAVAERKIRMKHG